MRFYPHRINDDADTRVAAYESLLDLFTVISFVLIFAAFIYVAQTAAGAKDRASVSAQNAVGGSGIPQALPNDVVLLIVSRENSIDCLTLIDGTTGSSFQWPVSADSIDGVLNGVSSTFQHASKINIGINEAHELVNPGIVLAIQRWLPNHGHHNYTFHFVGAQ